MLDTNTIMVPLQMPWRGDKAGFGFGISLGVQRTQ